MIPKNLPAAPDGYRWATMSVKQEDGTYIFSAKSDDIIRVRVEGHICHLVPISESAALAALAGEKDRTYFDPTTGEEFTVKGACSAASRMARHDAESGRGSARKAAEKAKEVLTDIDIVQGHLAGKVVVTEAMIEAAYEDGGPSAVTKLLKMTGNMR